MTSPLIRICVLTVSDRSSAGLRQDTSGAALVDYIRDHQWILVNTAIVPDEFEKIKDILTNWSTSGECDIILSTGGTGFSPRDITPEATRAVIEREAPGIAETIRAKGLSKTPHAMLSRAIAGIRARTLIVNLPGSPKGAIESLEFIAPVLAHATQLLGDDPDAEQGH